MLTAIYESLKPSNLQAVFRAVADEGCETRAEIAATTGLSIVTVGKAAEEFLEKDIFVQKNSHRKSVGRQAGRIRINPDYQVVVLHLAKRNFCVMYYDLAQKCTYRSEHEYISDYSYADNLCVFLHRVKSQMLASTDKRFAAMCAVLPGTYDTGTDTVSFSGDAELERIKIREFSKTKAGIPLDIVMDNLTASIRYCASTCRNNESILFIKIDEGIDMRLIFQGKILRRNSSCGPITFLDSDISRTLSGIIMSVCNIVGLNDVIIEAANLNNIEAIEEELKNKLTKLVYKAKQMPRIIINPSVCYATSGAAMLARNTWIERIMKL